MDPREEWIDTVIARLTKLIDDLDNQGRDLEMQGARSDDDERLYHLCGAGEGVETAAAELREVLHEEIIPTRPPAPPVPTDSDMLLEAYMLVGDAIRVHQSSEDAAARSNEIWTQHQREMELLVQAHNALHQLVGD